MRAIGHTAIIVRAVTERPEGVDSDGVGPGGEISRGAAQDAGDSMRKESGEADLIVPHVVGKKVLPLGKISFRMIRYPFGDTAIVPLDGDRPV